MSDITTKNATCVEVVAALIWDPNYEFCPADEEILKKIQAIG